MLPWLLLGGAAAAGLLWYLLTRKKQEPPQPQPQPMPSPTSDPFSDGDEEQDTESDAGDEHAAAMRAHQLRKHQIIDAIAERIEFSSAPVVLKSVKVGEEYVATPYPADAIDIRPIQQISADELRRTLPAANALDDDVYYGQLASRQLLVMEHQERVDVFEDLVGQPRNVLLILQDISGSMNDNGRMGWAIGLCSKLIDRAEESDALVALIRFNDRPWDCRYAGKPEERAALQRDLPHYLLAGGGTNIDYALAAGLQILTDPRFTTKKMVLVTDGTQGVSVGAVRQALADLGVELHVVSIGQDNPDLQSIAAHYDLFPD